ncbi:hypothetical protein [Nonomuraea sp. NPDC050691]|uniref:hypothetical protein n=1 Tax=Nonomuraea sp. NPDC050691 TaxID=3155661 RepID=UPI0033EB81DA
MGGLAAGLAAVVTNNPLAGFMLARAAAGLSDGTISSDVAHLEQVRTWFGRPLWEMEPVDTDTYFGKVLRSTAKGGTRFAATPRGRWSIRWRCATRSRRAAGPEPPAFVVS